MSKASNRKRSRPNPVLARVPWEMSEERKPGEPVVSRAERMPPEAVRIGRFIARMANLGRKQLASNGLDELPDPCRSCAFRAGSVPNRCVDTQADALKCVFEGKKFLCHEPREGGRVIDQICWGFVRARAWAVEAMKDPGLLRAVNAPLPKIRGNSTDAALRGNQEGSHGEFHRSDRDH